MSWSLHIRNYLHKSETSILSSNEIRNCIQSISLTSAWQERWTVEQRTQTRNTSESDSVSRSRSIQKSKHWNFRDRNIHEFITILYSRPSSRSMTLSLDFDDDCLGVMIHHRLFDQFVTCFELLLDALELDTFYDDNCRVDSSDFNAVKIMEKDAGLTAQMRSRIIDGFESSIAQLPPPSPARIDFCTLTTSHTLRDIIVTLNQTNSMLRK